MRAAGTLLTVLALLAVQAPWIACACDGDAALTPLLLPALGGVAAHHESGHACHDGIAHLVHGDAHRQHHHHACGCTHEGPSHPDTPAPTDGHDGFMLPLLAVSGPVQLDAPQVAPALFGFLPDASRQALAPREHAEAEPDPPGRPAVPAAATERLLL